MQRTFGFEVDEELYYLAGFFDGEGSVMVLGGKADRARLAVTASQVVRWPLERFQARFGGRIGLNKSRGNRRPSYQWICSDVTAYRFLCTLAPYLVVKKEVATLGLRYYEAAVAPRGGRRSVTPQAMALGKNLAQRIKGLNAKGRTGFVRQVEAGPYLH